jgi:hypothetical protein
LNFERTHSRAHDSGAVFAALLRSTDGLPSPSSPASTIADSMSKLSVAGPFEQWFMPGSANIRAKPPASPPLLALSLLDPVRAGVEREHAIAWVMIEDDLVARPP